MIDVKSYPVYAVLKLLLQDKTTKKNIIWATAANASLGSEYLGKEQIMLHQLVSANAIDLQPRIFKSMEAQAERTKKHAEVFTPAWICNKMNNHCDEVWFKRKNVFNTEIDGGWVTTEAPIRFTKRRTWKHYVDSRRLEITCGEAPYIVSRYDTSTGKLIPICDRIGILDRKLRVVNENATTEAEWMKWTIRAFQSVYGYEFQGDNLLIGRINLLMTFTDYLMYRWKREATYKELKKIANIIAWNLWQMDGLKGTVPLGALGETKENPNQLSLFDEFTDEATTDAAMECRIFDWRGDRSMRYNQLKR